MKIIDFKKKGNVVRFYLGEDDCNDYHGDDWDDSPYEHNAGEVYEEYVKEHVDIAFDFDCLVLEPQDDWHNQSNSEWCKDDMKDRLVPCIIVVPRQIVDYNDDFRHYIGMADVVRYYFGDKINDEIKYGRII